MNFYGTTTGSQHTLFGRIVPIMGALRLAIWRAAEQPLPEVQFANELPEWGHCIANELTSTVFKGIVNMAPNGKKYHARNSGQVVGLLIRTGIFYWKEVPAMLERDGFNKLTPEQEKKLEKLTGWEVGMAQASQLAGHPINTKAQFTKFWTRRLSQFVLNTIKVGWTIIRNALKQPVPDVLQFLSGVPEGFKCFLNADGEFAKIGKRTEVFFVLLAYWPEIEEMRQARPPRTRKVLLDWLEKQEGKQLVQSDEIFYGICGDISLDVGLVGHPTKILPGQL